MVVISHKRPLWNLVLAFAILLGTVSLESQHGVWARGRHQTTTASSVSVSRVLVSPDGNGLSFQADRNFSPAETQNFSTLKLPSPYRLVMDIPNAKLNTTQRSVPIHQGGIERVELSDTQSPFYNAVRAVVFVENSQVLGRLTPVFEGANLKLVGAVPYGLTPEQMAAPSVAKMSKIAAGSAKPLPPQLKPDPLLSAAKKTPLPQPSYNKEESQAPASMSGTQLASAQNILEKPVAPGTAIIQGVYLDEGRLVLKSTPGSELHVKNRFTLTEPNRLVLEIDQAVLANRDLLKPIATNFPDLRQVRVGQFDDKTVRVVIEGQSPEQCEAVYYGGEKNLLAITPYASTSITKLSANTRLGEVESIDLKRDSGATIIRLEASTPIVHRFLKKDDRVVLDLLNQASRPTNINFDNRQYPEIEKMQLEPLTAGEPNSKLVINLSRANTRVVPSLSNDGKILELQMVAENPPATPVTNNGFSNLAVLGPAGKAPYAARIVVDAGHGGKDNGAMRSGVNEKDLNLSLALMVRDALEAKGFKVYMTRSSDVFLPLPQITAITNQIHPDLFISIHHNASVNSALNGIETYYYTPQSIALARRVHAREIDNVGARDGGVKKAMFYVIHHTNVPAILCEVGYVSSPSELSELQGFERKNRTARAIADGVVDYLRTQMSARATTK